MAGKSETMREVAALLKEEVEKKTLTVAAAKTVTKLRKEHASALKTITYLRGEATREGERYDELVARSRDLETDHVDLIKVCAGHKDRAAGLVGARQEVRVQGARLDAYLEALERQDETLRILFRAPVVRRNIARKESATEPDANQQYSGSTVSTTRSVTETEEVTEE